MAQTVRAIYERGQLRLRDDVELSEGQQVQLSETISAERREGP